MKSRRGSSGNPKRSFSRAIQAAYLGFALCGIASGCSHVQRPSRKAPPVPATGAPSVSQPSPSPSGQEYGPSLPELAGNETYGPPVPGGGPSAPAASPGPLPEATYGPELPVAKPLILVVGPGMAREFALVGVLEGLHRAKIPIGAVYCGGLGSLLAAAYALEGNINHFEWALQRLRDESFVRSGIMSTLFVHSVGGDRFTRELELLVGHHDLAQAKVPLVVATYGEKASPPVLVDKGDAVGVLESAMSAPGMFTADVQAASKALSESPVGSDLLIRAKSAGKAPIVFIDLSGRVPSPERPEPPALKDIDLVIRPNMKTIGYLDYDRRAEAAFRGKSAVKKNLVALKRLAGMPPDPLDSENTQGSLPGGSNEDGSSFEK